MINETRHSFFLDKPVGTESGSVFMDTCLMTIGTFGYFYRRMLGVHGHFMKTVVVLMVWIVVKSFVQNTLEYVKGEKQKHEPTWTQINKQFNAVRELADMINEKFGMQILCIVTSSCSYYSNRFYEILDTLAYRVGFNNVVLDRLEKVKTITWLTIIFLYCVCIPFFSADICHQVCEICKYLN